MKRIFMMAALVYVAGCTPADNSTGSDTQAPDANKQVVATVNGESLYDDVVDFYGQARFQGAPVTPDQKALLIEDLTQLYALASAARSQGLDNDNQVEMQINLQRKGMLAQMLVQKHTAENPVTEDQVKAAYDAGEAGEEYKARHILVKEEAEAQEMINQLDGGADFAELAKEHSVGPSAKDGGMLGEWFPATQMVKPFADALPGIAPGTYSKGPVQTQFGWHVILVEEKRQQPFDQVKAQIMEKMQNERVRDYIESVKSTAQIELKP